MSNPPSAKFKSGAVEVTAWRNTDAQGKSYLTYSVERIYKDKDGNFKRTSTMREHDLMRLRWAVEKALDWYYAGGEHTGDV